MKELSIKQKAQRYDEALKAAVVAHKDEDKHLKATLERIFPELKESEDERIRNYILFHLQWHLDTAREFTTKGFSSPFSAEEIKMLETSVAWLKKNGKNNMGISEATKQKLEDNLNRALEKETPESWNKFLDEQGEQKPADNDTKFHEGDWIINNEHNNVAKVLEINNEQYRLDYGDTVGTITIALIDNDYHLWTIQDAKDGDVLSYREGQWCFIYKEKIDDKSFYYHALYSTVQGLTIANTGFTLLNNAITPATKEQRDTLMKAMDDDGYTFDFKKKELKKIEQNHIDKYKEWYDFIRWFVKQRTDDYNLIPSRDDIHKWGDDILNHARKVLEQNTTAWSKEDKNGILNTMALIEGIKNSNPKDEYCVENCDYCLHWLKSIKDRYTWKPSIAQINALSIVSKGNAPDDIEAIVSLYQDLKKIKGK